MYLWELCKYSYVERFNFLPFTQPSSYSEDCFIMSDVYLMAMPSLRWLVAFISPQKPEFNPRLVQGFHSEVFVPHGDTITQVISPSVTQWIPHGCTGAQMVNCCPLIMETHVQSKGNLCGICGVQGSGAGLSLSSPIFPHQLSFHQCSHPGLRQWAHLRLQYEGTQSQPTTGIRKKLCISHDDVDIFLFSAEVWLSVGTPLRSILMLSCLGPTVPMNCTTKVGIQKSLITVFLLSA